VNILRASNDARKLVFLLILAFHHCLDDTGMIRSKVNEAMRYASLAIVR
jgi:hypothetical protein